MLAKRVTVIIAVMTIIFSIYAVMPAIAQISPSPVVNETPSGGSDININVQLPSIRPVTTSSPSPVGAPQGSSSNWWTSLLWVLILAIIILIIIVAVILLVIRPPFRGYGPEEGYEETRVVRRRRF